MATFDQTFLTRIFLAGIILPLFIILLLVLLDVSPPLYWVSIVEQSVPKLQGDLTRISTSVSPVAARSFGELFAMSFIVYCFTSTVLLIHLLMKGNVGNQALSANWHAMHEVENDSFPNYLRQTVALGIFASFTVVAFLFLPQFFDGKYSSLGKSWLGAYITMYVLFSLLWFTLLASVLYVRGLFQLLYSQSEP